MGKAKSPVTRDGQAGITPQKPPQEPTKIEFGKRTLLTFARYTNRVDLLGALLEEKRAYTLEEVDSLLHRFMKGL